MYRHKTVKIKKNELKGEGGRFSPNGWFAHMMNCFRFSGMATLRTKSCDVMDIDLLIRIRSAHFGYIFSIGITMLVSFVS